MITAECLIPLGSYQKPNPQLQILKYFSKRIGKYNTIFHSGVTELNGVIFFSNLFQFNPYFHFCLALNILDTHSIIIKINKKEFL